jgi:hypothetical protein
MADISTIDLTLRSETSSALTQTQNDTNLTDIQTAVNALVADVNILRKSGEMYTENNATTTGTLTADAWIKYNFGTIASEHVFGDVTFDATTGTLVCATAGQYAVNCNISFLGTTGNTLTFTMGVGDGVTQSEQTQHQVARRLGSSDVGACGFNGVVTATAGQKIGLMLMQDSTQAVTVVNFTMTIKSVIT